jgi:uncharacterized protein (TIGR02147 family)
MKPVTDYLEYRDFLRDLYNDKKSVKPYFSYRFIAKKLSIDPSHVVKIFQKQRHISVKLIEGCIELAELKGREAEYFATLVHFNKTKTDSECKLHFQKLLALKDKDVRAFTLEKGQYEFFQNWYYSAILTLLEFYPFRNDYAALSKKLNPPITESQAKKAVALLRKLKLIKKQPDGTFGLTSTMVTTGEQWRSLAISSFQEETMRLALESLHRIPREDRNISTVTVTLSKNDLDEANEILKECRTALLKLAENQKNPERVYQINMQLFPVTV